jgi:hypothetical protein
MLQGHTEYPTTKSFTIKAFRGNIMNHHYHHHRMEKTVLVLDSPLEHPFEIPFEGVSRFSSNDTTTDEPLPPKDAKRFSTSAFDTL